MISTTLVYPDQLLKEADFRSKVNLARALGLLDQRTLACCSVLNSARNSIVHRLDALAEKWKIEMERLAYGRGISLRQKRNPTRELNKTLRELVAVVAIARFESTYHSKLNKLRRENRDRWMELMIEKLRKNTGSDREELSYEVDLELARELSAKSE